MSEWNEWVQHDGSGCPCVGQYVQVEFFSGVSIEGVAGGECKAHGIDVNGPDSAWVWIIVPHSNNIKKYRTRKSKSVELLKDILLELPEKILEDA